MTDFVSPLPSASARACLAAGLVAAFEMSVLLGALEGDAGVNVRFALLVFVASFIAASLIAAVHLLFAVPLYLMMRRRRVVGTSAAAAWGFLIGALPSPILFPPMGGSPVDMLRSLLLCAVPGLIAGFIFGRRVNRAD